MSKGIKPSITAIKIKGVWYYTTELWKENKDGSITFTDTKGNKITGNVTSIVVNSK